MNALQRAEQRRRWAGMRAVCERKRYYATEAEAQYMALGETWRLGKPMYAYACVVCGGWHLTDDAPRESANVQKH